MNIQKGNPYSALLKFTDASGAAYDLTDKTVFFTLKRKSDFADNDNDALIKKDITVHTAPTDGETTLELTAAQTLINSGQYKCDIRIYKNGEVQANTDIFYADILDIVTKRTS